jgi:hypothetical protein
VRALGSRTRVSNNILTRFGPIGLLQGADAVNARIACEEGRENNEFDTG